MIENTDYEFIPADDDKWHVRILTGDFIETVIMYDKLQLVDEELHFNYEVIFTSIDELNEEDKDLQKVVRDILFDIIERAVGSEQG